MLFVMAGVMGKTAQATLPMWENRLELCTTAASVGLNL